MNVEQVNINSVIPYARNPRKNDLAVDKVASSIKEFGFRQPIVVDTENVIIAGHTRYLAARKLNINTIPVHIAEGLTSQQVKAYRIADNRVSQESEWDYELLKLELPEIDGLFTGFDQDEIDELLFETVDGLTDEDAVPDIPEQPITVEGDIWLLGNHRLMCGDSTKIDQVERLMDGQKADMVFTDPPYNVSFNGRSGKFEIIENDALTDNAFESFINEMIRTIKMVDPKAYYIWCNWNFYGLLQDKLPYKSCIVWAKNVFGLGRGYRHQHEFCMFNGKVDDVVKNESDLWEISKDFNHIHPTQKPVALCVRAFSNHIKLVNVLDLFGGSGSTLIGAEQTGRNAFLMEIDLKYCDVIVKRWQDFTGKEAILESTNKLFNEAA